MTPQELADEIRKIENPHGLTITGFPKKGEAFEITLESFADHLSSLSFLEYEAEAERWLLQLEKCYKNENRFHRIPLLLGTIVYIAKGDIKDVLLFSCPILITNVQENIQYYIDDRQYSELILVLDFIAYNNMATNRLSNSERREEVKEEEGKNYKEITAEARREEINLRDEEIEVTVSEVRDDYKEDESAELAKEENDEEGIIWSDFDVPLIRYNGGNFIETDEVSDKEDDLTIGYCLTTSDEESLYQDVFYSLINQKMGYDFSYLTVQSPKVNLEEHHIFSLAPKDELNIIRTNPVPIEIDDFTLGTFIGLYNWFMINSN